MESLPKSKLSDLHLQSSLNSQSQTKPITISWIYFHNNQSSQEENNQISDVTVQPVSSSNILQAKFGLCHCPGKKLQRGRDGKEHNRDLKQDLKQFKEINQVSTIICLLNEYELRTIGVDFKKYKSFAQELGIDIIHYPIIEMSVPEVKDMSEFDQSIINEIMNRLSKGQNIICHCRGGIGRAGLIGSCVLLKSQQVKKGADAITIVRRIRDKRCVESQKQENFVSQFSKYIQNQ